MRLHIGASRIQLAKSELRLLRKRTVNRRVGFSRLGFFAWRIFGGGSVFFLLVGCRRSASGVSGCS